MWGIVFMLRMAVKQYSLSKKAGWEEYKAKTWPLLPKLANNTGLSLVVYTIFFGTMYFCLTHGGMEASIKIALGKQ